MLRPDLAPELVPLVQSDDFTSPWLRTIWQAVEGCVSKGQPTILQNVGMVLEHWGRLNEMGGALFLFTLCDEMFIFAANNKSFPHYAKTVHRLAEQRRAAAAMLRGDMPEQPNANIRGGFAT